MNFFGCYDMFGNVREWCWNESPGGRCIRGGAWDDFIYMSRMITQAPPLDRSPKNGFRCVLYLEIDKIPAASFQPYADIAQNRDFYNEEPVPEEVFQVFRDQYKIHPAADPFNDVSRVTVPTLMLNGKYDITIYTLKEAVEPMYKLVGIPEDDKDLKLCDSDHFIPKNVLIKETLDWLDRYLGPVK